MRRLYKAVLHLTLLWGVSLNVDGSACMTMDAKETTPSRITYDVWGYIGDYCDVGTLKNLSVCSQCTHTYPQQSLRKLKEWKDGGGLVVVTFGNPTNEDISNVWRLKGVGRIDFNQLAYQSIVNLLVEYIRINGADAAELDRISANASAAIDAHPTLTRSQKQLLIESLLPNIPLNETRLSRGYLAGSCQCEARHLEDSRAQYRECQCWVGLSNTDLRRFTPRFIACADEVTSSEDFITLYFAHVKYRGFGMLFKPLDYPNAALQRVLNQKLIEELNSGRLQGSDVIKLSMFFTLVRDWENAEQAMDQFVGEQDSFKMWLFADLMKQFHFGVTKPVIQYGTTLRWMGSKVWSWINAALEHGVQVTEKFRIGLRLTPGLGLRVKYEY